MEEKTKISKQVQNEFVIDDGRIESIEEFLTPRELFDDLISRVNKYSPESVPEITKAFEMANKLGVTSGAIGSSLKSLLFTIP